MLKLAVQETFRSSPNLLEAITLLQKALAVHDAGGSGQADTTVILSKPDTNTGSTYDEYLSEISQNLENVKKEHLLSIKILQNFFKTLYTMTQTLKNLKIF